jgi:CHAT domain
VLHYIPWSALKELGGSFLADQVSLAMVPSASVWHQLADRLRPPVRNALVLGNPTMNLPEAEREAANVADLLAPLNVLT